MLGFRHYRKLIKAFHNLQHFLGTAASAVAVAEHGHGLSPCVFILISLPVFLNLAGHIPCDKVGGRYAGINLASVNTLPDKVVVGETVCIVPGGHFV